MTVAQQLQQLQQQPPHPGSGFGMAATHQQQQGARLAAPPGAQASPVGAQ
jgi:hypothetical protein